MSKVSKRQDSDLLILQVAKVVMDASLAMEDLAEDSRQNPKMSVHDIVYLARQHCALLRLSNEIRRRYVIEGNTNNEVELVCDS